MNTQKTTALELAARTISGVSDIGGFPAMFNELIIYLNVTAVSGTTPSMTMSYQSSPDGTNWYDNQAGSAITVATNQIIKIATAAGSYGRLSYVISGTTPSFTFSAVVEGKQQ